jgi:hypothetical protein
MELGLLGVVPVSYGKLDTDPPLEFNAVTITEYAVPGESPVNVALFTDNKDGTIATVFRVKV